MAKVINKLMNWAGFENEGEDGAEDEVVEPRRESLNNSFVSGSSKRGKIVNINTTTQLQVVVITPESFEDAKDIADQLKSKKPVVINLESIGKDIAQRIIDFLGGSVYAVDGNIQKVSKDIFLIAPYNVNIMGDFKDELRNKGVFTLH